MSIRDRTNIAPLYEFTLEPGFDDAIRGQKSTTIDDTLESTVAWNVDESNVRAASGENGANEIDFAGSHGPHGTGPTRRLQRD